jgi:hypothetical protein
LLTSERRRSSIERGKSLRFSEEDGFRIVEGASPLELTSKLRVKVIELLGYR